MGPTVGLHAIDEQKYMPLVKNENRSLDRPASYTINTLNPLPTVDAENQNIVFKVKTLNLSFFCSDVIPLRYS